MTWESSRRAAAWAFGIILAFTLGQKHSVPQVATEVLIAVLVLCGIVVATGWRPVDRRLRRIRYRRGRPKGDLVDIQVARGPQNVVAPFHISFLTQSRGDIVFSFDYRPSRIVFLNLGGIQIRDSDLLCLRWCYRLLSGPDLPGQLT